MIIGYWIELQLFKKKPQRTAQLRSHAQFTP
jgi:hypothetical protein